MKQNGEYNRLIVARIYEWDINSMQNYINT